MQKESKQKIKIYFNGFNTIFGCALLVTGTCIGAGMLGLPISTAAAGFYPTLFSFIGVWVLMTFTALAFLEVSLLAKGEPNLLSLAELTLGVTSKRIAWLTYLLFLYSVMAAYTVGGATIISQILAIDISLQATLLLVSSLFALPFAWIIYSGTKIVDYVNRLFILGLVVSFGVMCVLVAKDQSVSSLNSPSNPKFILHKFSLLIVSFGYHLLIPSLKTYLRSNVTQLRWGIILGGLLPLIFYMVWEYIILSLIPTWGRDGLVSMLYASGNPADLLISFLAQNNSKLSTWVAFFSFMALVSSFVGVALSIYDFFADGLKIKKTPLGKINLLILTFIPPIIYTMLFPQGFLLALGYAGIFATILLVIYPVTMTWASRNNIYLSKLKTYQVFGGKLALASALFAGIVLIILEILAQLQLLPVP